MSIAEKLAYIGKTAALWTIAHKRMIVFGALAALISTTSFAAGYLLAREADHAPISIQR